MSNSVMENPRLVELLVQRAVDGLNSSERAELKQLLSEERYVDAGRFEYTAASLLLAGDVENNVPEEMPYSLRERLMAQADTVAGSMEPAPRQTSSQPRVISIAGRSRSSAASPAVNVQPVSKASTSTSTAPSRKPTSWGGKVGWFAAAASVLIALAGWWPRLQMGVDPTVETPLVSTLEQEREQLRAQQGVLTRTWQTTQDPAASGVTGDVVWDQRTQNGYLRFRGLQANNSDQLQYQLWIFDGERDERYPIDGGVFDIPPGQSEVIVPITAKLQVLKPAMFAVTIEKAGGSVVSSRDRIVVLAPVAAG